MTALEFRTETVGNVQRSYELVFIAAGRLGIGVTDPDQILELNDQTSGNYVEYTLCWSRC